MRVLAGSLIALLFLGSACGGDGTDEQEPTAARSIETPALRMVAPSSISVGEDLMIFGENFADKEIGQTRLFFDGVYQTTSGQSQPVKLEVLPKFVSQGVMSWTFGPNVPFTTAEDTGTFRGVLNAQNVGVDGQVKPAAQAIGVEITVLPSILIRQMRPLNAGCAVGITATTDDTPFLFELKAIGLRSGSQLAPLRFVYTFMKENFQLQGYVSNTLGVDPESLFPKTGPVSIIDSVTDGTISTLGSGAPRNVNVAQGSFSSGVNSLPTGLDSVFGLTQLSTAPILDSSGKSYEASMNIVAIDSTGSQARRTISLRVWTPIEVDYNGQAVVTRTYDPVPVSGCISGSDIGIDVSYSETSSETRSRSFKVNTKVGGGLDIKVVRLNAEFGFDVDSTVSSSQSTDLRITGKILPKQFGVFYRQTVQLERTARLILHDGCGNALDAGSVTVTDWRWSPDLAKGSKCPPLPPSNLPPGQIFDSGSND